MKRKLIGASMQAIGILLILGAVEVQAFALAGFGAGLVFMSGTFWD